MNHHLLGAGIVAVSLLGSAALIAKSNHNSAVLQSAREELDAAKDEVRQLNTCFAERAAAQRQVEAINAQLREMRQSISIIRRARRDG